ncbi:hypothetical protein KAR34_02360 [bacterium]|nr:hypothetical protein [bacterium]
MKKIWLLQILGLFSLASLAWGSWVQDGGSLNTDPEVNASYPSIAVTQNTPIVCWQEGGSPNKIYVKLWTGSAWIALGTSLNVFSNRSAIMPNIDILYYTPYVAWSEHIGDAYKVIVKKWDTDTWIRVGGDINLDVNKSAWYAEVTISNNTPYIAWSEDNGEFVYLAYVKYLNGSTWEQLGSSININPNETAVWPSLVFNEYTPYIAWVEETSSATQIYVKFWNGSDWEQVGGSVNINTVENANHQSLCFYNSTPYIAFAQENGINSQIYVRYWTGSIWSTLGGALNNDPNRDADYPSIVFHLATPYVAWQESNGFKQQIIVKTRNFSTWTQVGGSLNVNPDIDGVRPRLAASDSTLYVTWYENEFPAQAIVQHYTFPLSATPTVTPSNTPVSTETRPPTFLGERGAATPNPFLPALGQRTQFQLASLEEQGEYMIRIWDIAGRLVRTLRNVSEWDGSSEAGHLCEGGVYIFQIQTQERSSMGKVVLIK